MTCHGTVAPGDVPCDVHLSQGRVGDFLGEPECILDGHTLHMLLQNPKGIGLTPLNKQVYRV